MTGAGAYPEAGSVRMIPDVCGRGDIRCWDRARCEAVAHQALQEESLNHSVLLNPTLPVRRINASNNSWCGRTLCAAETSVTVTYVRNAVFAARIIKAASFTTAMSSPARAGSGFLTPPVSRPSFTFSTAFITP